MKPANQQTSKPANQLVKIFLFILLILNSSCHKDLESGSPLTSPQTIFSDVRKKPSEQVIHSLRQSFNSLNQNQSNLVYTTADFYASLNPIWGDSRYMPSTNDSVIYVPLLDITLIGSSYKEAFLTIIDRPKVDEYGLLVFNMDSTYYINSGITPDINNFTGVVYQVTSDGQIINFNSFLDGQFTGYVSELNQTSQSGTGIVIRDLQDDCINFPFDPVKCPTFGKSFWDKLGDFFNGIWNGIINIFGDFSNWNTGSNSGSSGWMGGVWTFGGGIIYFKNNSNPPGGENPGTNPPNSNTYQLLKDVFDATVFKKANRLAQATMNQLGIKANIEDFWNTLGDASLIFINANLNWSNSGPINEIELVETAFEELLFLKDIGFPLNTTNNLETPAYQWLSLTSNHDVYFELKEHYESNKNKPQIKETHINAVEYLSNHNDIPVKDFLDAYDDWFNTPDPMEIQNGINILSSNVPTSPPTATFLVQTEYRHPWVDPFTPPEDMQHGYSGNTTGIKGCSDCTDNQMFNSMTALFEWTSTNPLQTEAYKYIGRFEDKSGGVYSNDIVSNAIKSSTTYKNFVKTVGGLINSKLINNNGNFNGINFLSQDINILNQNRPKFNGFSNKINGLQILINDTEQTQISHLGDFVSNPNNGEWEITLIIDIVDHFGLDRHDAITYQGWHSGFPNWWRLQHTKDYTPFITNFHVVTKIKGDYKP
ncbi:MAG: DUF3289 family protein [Saprospiraceae bacterium]|nr:DUF3289 family protein [Saprospiraceae bacterium]